MGTSRLLKITPPHTCIQDINFCRATTHTDLVLRARELSIPTRSIPNASILTSIGTTGLQLYNFGQTVSMVFFLDNWKPASFYDRINENVSIGLHTLVLLDIKVKEQSEENLARSVFPVIQWSDLILILGPNNLQRPQNL